MAFLIRGLALAAIVAFSACSPKPAGPPSVAVTDAWIRATQPGAQTAAAYVTLTNTGGEPDRLVSVSTPAAMEAMVHQSVSEDGMASMKAAPGLALPPGEAVILKPGGYHIMLMDLPAPLQDGSRALVTLTFARAGTKTLEFPVRAAAPTGAPHRH